METKPRFPEVSKKAGHYESFYVKACAPAGGRGVWIRHTVHKRPGEDPVGSVWFTWFDAEIARPRATKLTVPASELAAPEDAWIRVAAAEIGPAHARGSIETETLSAAWDLRLSGNAGPCRYLPTDWLYEAPVPRTKFEAPCPNALFDGSLRVDREEQDVASWPGMIGHNWGSEHVERWVWLEGTGFDGAPDGYFDAGAARIKMGPITTSWIPAGMLVLDGEQYRLGGFQRIRSSRIEEGPTACDFSLPGKGLVVRGRVSAPAKDFVGWIYADPVGPEHNVLNCSIADLELEVRRKGHATRRLSLAGGAAYELGMREGDHGIPIQPYPDG